MEVLLEPNNSSFNSLFFPQFVKYIGKEGLAEVDVDDEGKWCVCV